MQARDPTASSQDFHDFRQFIHLMTADHELISLAAPFPHVASAIHNFVIANPAEISEQLLQCGVIFTGSVCAIRRVSLCDLSGVP
jgi:hypothetical protein